MLPIISYLIIQNDEINYTRYNNTLEKFAQTLKPFNSF